MPGRYAFSPEQSHNSRHGLDTAAANEYMIHRSATAWSVWAASQDPNNLEIIKNFNREVRTRGAIIYAEGKLGAYEKLVQLSQSAKSESVQLKACLAIIEFDSSLMAEMENDLRLTKMENLIAEYLGEGYIK